MLYSSTIDLTSAIVEVFLQKRRDDSAAKRFFKRLMKNHQGELRNIVTDKLRSYGVAHREFIPFNRWIFDEITNGPVINWKSTDPHTIGIVNLAFGLYELCRK